jgi:hypothetical protein
MFDFGLFRLLLCGYPLKLYVCPYGKYVYRASIFIVGGVYDKLVIGRQEEFLLIGI